VPMSVFPGRESRRLRPSSATISMPGISSWERVKLSVSPAIRIKSMRPSWQNADTSRLLPMPLASRSGGSFQTSYYELTSRLVTGRTLLAKVLHDASVGLDYLESREDVDRERMGFIGHSYGGRMALWVPAFDKRVKASVSHCGCVNYKDSLNRDAGIQMEFCVPNIMEVGDIEDVVALAPPAALLISATDQDKWSRGAQAIFNSARHAFSEGDLCLKIWPGGHVFTKAMRKEAYAFLDRRLT